MREKEFETLYLAVTNDQYEHIFDFDNSPSALAKRCGVSKTFLSRSVTHNWCDCVRNIKFERIKIAIEKNNKEPVKCARKITKFNFLRTLREEKKLTLAQMKTLLNKAKNFKYKITCELVAKFEQFTTSSLSPKIIKLYAKVFEIDEQLLKQKLQTLKD